VVSDGSSSETSTSAFVPVRFGTDDVEPEPVSDDKYSISALSIPAKMSATPLRRHNLPPTITAMSSLQHIHSVCYTVSQEKRHAPFYICDNLVRCHPISPILGRNIPSGNLKQAHIHISVVSICSYTVSCKNWPRFLRHTVQRQIRRLHIILTSDNYQVTLTVIRKNTVHIIKASV